MLHIHHIALTAKNLETTALFYDPGAHHYCFRVDEKHLVDEVFVIAKSFGAEILDAPVEYPRYAKNVGSRTYYAVFFTDPNNIKLEFAWMPALLNKWEGFLADAPYLDPVDKVAEKREKIY